MYINANKLEPEILNPFKLENFKQKYFNFLMLAVNKKLQIFRYQTLKSQDIYTF